ncbi:beta-xylosidase [Flavobacterium gilvum]|uniref:Beta-xylosidase n=2 Tax=Flavobacterium gilvum TaxID=1492737 RepID=A0AAC9I8F0_9FLAO|nr:beta-xylosidase [Flavobacterium gilvum]KFC59925.1 glycosyl hydrolase family 43 [Flavobacterium gilvum]
MTFKPKQRRNKSIFINVFMLTLIICGSTFYSAKSQTLNIKNDVFWYTKNKLPINSQGGGIFTFPDPKTGEKKYYWYGVYYKEADTYRDDPSVTLKNNTFESVTCYSSTDLVNWTFEANVLTNDELKKQPDYRKTWVGRLGVAYIPEIKKYAMFVQHGGEVLITVSDSPTGQFTWHQQISMKEMIGTTNTGDQTVFTDDNGKSYLIYSYGQGRNKIYVSEIGMKNGMVNLLDCTEVFKGENREGNCMFKYKNKYYLAASNIYGWDSSLAYYLVSDNIRGPYEAKQGMMVMNGCADDYAHVTQTGFFVTLKGSKQETVVYCGDRWANFAGNGLGYNQWFPLSFEGHTPYFNSLGSWNLNVKTGEWNVAPDNNFVKNGSFEADRRTVPNPVKPRQSFMTGWNNKVIEGNQISFDTITSPYTNHENSESDRKIVIGEKSLSISDKVNFKREVSQTITSSPFVKLEKGSYSLTARVKNGGKFTQLEMYATSNEKTLKYKITEENTEWKTIKIENIKVENEKVIIGFLANGSANAFCYVDDISLVKNR